MFCMHCGTRIPDKAHFCPECGKIIDVKMNPPGGQENVGNRTVSPLSATSTVPTTKPGHKKKEPTGKTMLAIAALTLLLAFMSFAIDNKSSYVDVPAESDDSAAAADLVESEVPSSVVEEPDLESIRIDKSQKPSEAEAEPAVSAAPLSDFWIGLKNEGHTITLRAYETHDEVCIIPSEYTIEGETWHVTRIDDACFFGRTGLECLVIPEGVTSIGHNAFNSCTVKELYLPSTLENIEGIFEYLDHSDRTIYYAGSAEDWWAIQGADGITENIDLIGNTPAPAFTDETNYAVADLVTQRTNAEQLGSSAANALNGLLQGFNEGMEETDNDEYGYDY